MIFQFFYVPFIAAFYVYLHNGPLNFSTNFSSDLLKSSEEKSLILFEIEREVGRENFTYFNLIDEGTIRLTLITLEGDADMYISQSEKIPTFYPDKYDLHSASCGEDTIIIPKTFKRPITVAIYGASHLDVSKFVIYGSLLPDSQDNYPELYKEQFKNIESKDDFEKINGNEKLKRIDEPKPQRGNKKIRNDVRSGYWGLLELILMIL